MSPSSVVALGWSSSFLVFKQTLDPVQLLLERHPDGVPDAARTLGDFLALFVLDVDTLSPRKLSNSVWDFYIINIISTYYQVPNKRTGVRSTIFENLSWSTPYWGHCTQ